MNTEVLHLFIPGRGVASARLRPEGDFYDMEHPTGPGSLRNVTRVTHRTAIGTFVRISDVDPVKVAAILSTPPLEDMDGTVTLRQRLKRWEKWVNNGNPLDLARVVAFQWWKRGPVFDSEKRYVGMARALLRQCLNALPTSPSRSTALDLLDNPPTMVNR